MPDATGPLVVAWLYNDNGMGSWCVEAARALAEAGEDVVLIHSRRITPPEFSPKVRTVVFDFPGTFETGLFWKVKRKLDAEIGHLLRDKTGFVWLLHQHLTRVLGIHPRAYLLNQTDLEDPRVVTPQYVTAWAYPTDREGYLRKSETYAGASARSIAGIRATRYTLGWYRRDWRAYRSATGILCVSQRIAGELNDQGLAEKTYLVHPGTAIAATPPETVTGLDNRDEGPLRIVSVALQLEEPRKRVRWMIEALKTIPAAERDFTLTLIGNASDEFQAWAKEGGFPVVFAGRLPREKVQQLMRNQDLFLFGSQLDDWGYVLIEAMGQGLAVAAADLSPFDEIIGDSGILYPANDPAALARQISGLDRERIITLRRAAHARAVERFSHPAFARSLLSALSPSAAPKTSSPAHR